MVQITGPAKETLTGIAILAALWMLIVIMVQPLVNYPLNDAWSYIQSVRSFVEEGKLEFGGWMSGPIITSILWGSLFSLPFGFSVEAVKMSALVLSLAGVIFTFLTVRLVTGKNMAALTAGTIIAINPLYINLSSTFMTDVQFYAFFSASLYFYFLFLKRRKYRFLITAFILALLSTFIRQFGIILPLAFGLYEWFSRSGRRQAVIHLSSFLFIAATYFIYSRYLATGGQDTAYRNISGALDIALPELAWRVFTRTGLILMEGGLWLFPLIIFWVSREKKKIREHWVVVVVALSVFMVPMIRMFLEWPAGNIMYDLGLGPLTTRDIFIEGHSGPLFGGQFFPELIRPVAFLGGIGIVLLAALKLARMKRPGTASGMEDDAEPGNQAVWVSLLLILFYMAVMMTSVTYFDRYILPLLVLLFLLIRPGLTVESKSPDLAARMAFTSVMVVYMFFGVLSTRFYLEWNRVRWNAAAELMKKGVPASQIDGGHEFNGWHGADIRNDGSWKTDEHTYVLSFSEMKNFHTIRKVYLDHPFSDKDVVFHVLKKNSR